MEGYRGAPQLWSSRSPSVEVQRIHDFIHVPRTADRSRPDPTTLLRTTVRPRRSEDVHFCTSRLRICAHDGRCKTQARRAERLWAAVISIFSEQPLAGLQQEPLRGRVPGVSRYPRHEPATSLLRPCTVGFEVIDTFLGCRLRARPRKHADQALTASRRMESRPATSSSCRQQLQRGPFSSS